MEALNELNHRSAQLRKDIKDLQSIEYPEGCQPYVATKSYDVLTLAKQIKILAQTVYDANK